ncbi:bacterial SH3 domain protein [Chlamydia ibidis]|uniref:Bacterial SH3 domain protein n=2 Tax=Chlamydia ibidis TaxID=1405396 RepID=S7J3N6_9CHLA|nr:SH3 domain-containing protein [Chlamydia ibidis]EPP35039.1 bacterial SH3 domain protein [Chlamydia ibidis]EQM62525.1 bacterial SH3 domain protein [Chlamydia ibidis 10-1398/6]
MRTLSIFVLLFALGMGVSSSFVHAADTLPGKSSVHQTDNAFSPFTGEIKGNRVRLRLAPHTDSSVIKELSKGDYVAVLGENKDYYIVSAPEGIKGYIFRTFVLDNVIEGEQVNVRLEPSTSAPVLVRLSRGTKVQPTDASLQGKWLEIHLPKECVFYVAKSFVSSKGPIDLYKRWEGQKKIAVDLLNSAVQFAQVELKKDLESIDLESIYKKINQVQTDEFRDVPGLQSLIQKALEDIQDAYLTKSLAKDKATTTTVEVNSTVDSSSLPAKGSLLSKHIRKQAVIKSSPMVQGRQAIEYSLFKIWASMQPEEYAHTLTQEAFYQEEQKKKQLLVGELEIYPHVVKNNPGDFLLKNKENTVAFVYATQIDLEKWVGKRVSVECLPRPNNHFAFPAYYVCSIKESAS